MGAWKVELDRAGVGEVLQSADMASLINGYAGTVAAGVHLPDSRGDVVVESYSTDRQAAAVVVRHPEAMGLQAKHGLLSRPAAAAGLEVRAR